MISLLVFLAPLIVILVVTYILKNTKGTNQESEIDTSLDSHLVKIEIEDPYRWWEDNRGRFIMGLIKASTFVCICFFIREPTMVALIIQIIVFIAIMICIANVFYFLGYIIERIAQPNDPEEFRKITFNLLYWFSILVNLSPLLSFGTIF